MSSANPYQPIEQINPAPAYQRAYRTMHMKSINPLSAAKVLGLFYVILGLIAGLFLAVVAGVGAAAGGNGMQGAGAAVGMIIFMPVVYGIGGFIGGALAALLYNLVAKIAGGIEFDVEG